MPVDLSESTTYQSILGKGRVLEAHNLLLRLATNRFGDPGEATAVRLRAVPDVERLERMADRVFDAAGWDDLLATL